VVAESMNASADRKLDREFGADYSMEPRGLTGFSPDAVDKVAAVPGVRSVAPVQFGTVKVANNEVSVIVADPAALTIPTSLKVESGTTTLGINEVLVQHTLALQRNWKVGSTVSGQYPDKATATLRVAGIFADNQVVNRPYIMSPASYRPHVTGILIQKAFIDLDDKNLKSARNGIQAALRAYPNIQLKDRQGAKDDARKSVDRALNVIMVLLALSIIIAALGIVNTLGLSVIERTREIGLLRAVGMSRGQIRAMIRYESVVIALFGAALGLSLGVTLGWALQRAMSTQGVEVLSIPVDRLGLYLLSAIVIGVVAAIWPAWRGARMNILDAIHHQ
jgi:putative ABC transport system permease protein